VRVLTLRELNRATLARQLLLAPAPMAAAVPTPPLPIILIATAPPRALAPIQVQAVRYVVAFDQPNGTVLGPIPQPPISAVLARYGDAWVLVPWEAGQVWLRAADVGLPDVADLAPPPAPAVVYVAAPPALEAPALAVPTPRATAQTTSERAAESGTERQRNIQEHYVDPNVAREWAAEQWREEHQVGDQVIP